MPLARKLLVAFLAGGMVVASLAAANQSSTPAAPTAAPDRDPSPWSRPETAIRLPGVPKTAKKLYRIARKQLRKGKPTAARQLLSRAVEVYPEFVPAWCELGRIHHSLGEYEAARDAYEQALVVDARYWRPYYELAALDLAEGSWAAAAEHAERVVELRPYTHAPAHLQLAAAHLMTGDLDAAEHHARLLLELDDEAYSNAWHVLAQAALARGLDAAAGEFLYRFIETDGTEVDQQLVGTLLDQLAPPETRGILTDLRRRSDSLPLDLDTLPWPETAQLDLSELLAEDQLSDPLIQKAYLAQLVRERLVELTP